MLQLVEGVGPVSARKRSGDASGGSGPAAADGAAPRPPADRLAAWASARRSCPAAARDRRRRADRRAREARDEPRPGPARRAPARRAGAADPARYPDGALRVQDLDQLVAAAHQATDPRHFVAELVLDPPSSSADLAQPPHLDEDYLTLSTIHSAKGLEWDSVHVLAVYDGNFPACLSAGTSEEIDEERRLLYVGMTRARRDAARSTCPCATTTARTGATTPTATASRRASSRPRCSPPAT